MQKSCEHGYDAIQDGGGTANNVGISLRGAFKTATSKVTHCTVAQVPFAKKTTSKKNTLRKNKKSHFTHKKALCTLTATKKTSTTAQT